MDLAAGLQKYYNTTLFHTNLYYADKFLNKHETIKKLKERGFKFKKIERMNFATINTLNRQFSFPYPLDIIHLYKKIKKNDVLYLSISKVKTNLLFMLLYLLNPKVKFIFGYHRPLHSEKLFSLYNLKYRLSILLLSLFKKISNPNNYDNLTVTQIKETSGLGISFLLGLNYGGEFSLHGSYLGTDIITTQTDLLGVPRKRFKSNGTSVRDNNDAVLQVEKRIGSSIFNTTVIILSH